MKKFELRQLIKEVMGVYLPASILAKKLSVLLMDKLNGEKNELINSRFSSEFFPLNYRDSKNEFFKQNNIRILSLTTFVYKRNRDNDKPKQNDVTGIFMKSDQIFDRVDQQIYYDGEISVHIYNWDYETDLKIQIESVLTHELEHLFDKIIKIDKSSYTSSLNKVKSQVINISGKSILKQYPILRDFMHLFYLALPGELNARVQQLYSEIRYMKNMPYVDIMREINNYSVFKDLNELLQSEVTIDTIFEVVPSDKQQEFVDLFHNELANNWSGKISYPKTAKEFFRYWDKQFDTVALKFQINLKRVVQNLKGINDEELSKDDQEKVDEIIHESIVYNECFSYRKCKWRFD